MTDTASTFAISAALITGGGAILYSLKDIPKKIWSKIQTKFIYKVTIYDYDDLYNVFEMWLFNNHNGKYRDTEAGYGIISSDLLPPVLKESTRKVNLQFRQGVDFFVIQYEGKRILVSKSKEKIENIGSRNLYSHSFTIKGFKARKQIESLLKKITDDYNSSLEDNRLIIYSFIYGSWGVINKRAVKSLQNVIIDKETKADLLQDLNNFVGRKKWYEDNNISYKRTYLFHGPPGTGKTTLSFAMASQLKRNIYSLNLSSIDNDEQMISAIRNIPDGAIFLIEDIDSAFNGRETIVKGDKKGLSFSCFINTLDGALSKEGLITIITTNHIEKLDPAMVRKGRVDKQIRIGNGENEQIEEYINNFYGKEFFLGDEEVSIPMSSVQEACIDNMDNPERAISKILEHKNEKTIVYCNTNT